MCWVCLALRKFRLNLLVFWLWVFLLKLKWLLPQNFLKDSVVWTGLCVAPAFMLSFSCWVALSAAKYFLFFWLQTCLNELLLHFCFSRALIPSAKSFWGVLLFWTELCVVPVSVLSFSRRAALSAAKYLQLSVFKFLLRSYFWCQIYQFFFWSSSTLNLIQDCISSGTYR